MKENYDLRAARLLGLFIEYGIIGTPSYKTIIGLKRGKYYLGRFSNLERAVQARKEAE
ncbi:hypothetical protein [Paenibacillus sp. NPDC057934]|uniref:hypothetical protein n=1 Tax=Paenibacillus sp. NPDC057934 TaxID=3346282 RepID=UPI0036DDEFDD